MNIETKPDNSQPVPELAVLAEGLARLEKQIQELQEVVRNLKRETYKYSPPSPYSSEPQGYESGY